MRNIRVLFVILVLGIVLAFVIIPSQSVSAKDCFQNGKPVPCPNYQNPTQPPPPTTTPIPTPTPGPGLQKLSIAPLGEDNSTPSGDPTEPMFNGGGPSSRMIGGGLAVLLFFGVLIVLSKRKGSQKAKGSSETAVVASVVPPLRITPSPRRTSFDGDLDEGGDQESGHERSAEIYDPATGDFTPATGTLAGADSAGKQGRMSHAAEHGGGDDGQAAPRGDGGSGDTTNASWYMVHPSDDYPDSAATAFNDSAPSTPGFGDGSANSSSDDAGTGEGSEHDSSTAEHIRQAAHQMHEAAQSEADTDEKATFENQADAHQQEAENEKGDEE